MGAKVTKKAFECKFGSQGTPIIPAPVNDKLFESSSAKKNEEEEEESDDDDEEQQIAFKASR